MEGRMGGRDLWLNSSETTSKYNGPWSLEKIIMNISMLKFLKAPLLKEAPLTL